MFELIVEYVALIGDDSLVDLSAFQYFNFIIKKYIRMTSIQKGRILEKNVIFLNFFYKETGKPGYARNENRTSRLTKDGTKHSLAHVIDGNFQILDYLTSGGKTITCLHLRQNFEYKHKH